MCADLARNPSKLPSPADSARPPPLRLRADGLPASEQLCLKAILDVLSGKLSPRGLAVTYLLAPDGKVAKQFVGPVDAKQVEQAIAEAGGKAG